MLHAQLSYSFTQLLLIRDSPFGLFGEHQAAAAAAAIAFSIGQTVPVSYVLILCVLML